MSDIEQKVWELHDVRLNDHEKRFERSERSFQEIEDQLKYIIGRMDNGVSPSMNDIKKDNAEIRVTLRDIDHKLEIQNLKLTDKIDTVHKSLLDRVEPLESSTKNMNKIYVWGILGGIVLGIAAFIMNKTLESIWKKEASSLSVMGIKAVPVKGTHQ